MALKICIIFLAGLYLAFLGLGVWFFKKTARLKPFKWKHCNKAINALRFMMYVVLIPIGLTCALALYLVYAEYIGLL